MFIIKKEPLQEIENIFSALKTGSDGSKTNELSKILSDAFHKDILVRVVPVNHRTSTNIFCMCVIPEESTVDKITESILKEESTLQTITSLWKKCSGWRVELDGHIMTPDFSDRELTALLLHEVGHIIDTNSVPMRLQNIVQFTLASADARSVATLKDHRFIKMLRIPFAQACMSSSIDSMKKELKADKFASNCGYLTDLVSAMTKIDRLCGGRFSTSQALSKSTDLIVNSMNQLRDRKEHLVRSKFLQLRSKLGPGYMQECVNDIIQNILLENPSPVYEAVDYIQESIFPNKLRNIMKKTLKPVTQAQVDYITARVEGIRTVDDKVMLLSYANSKLALCEYYLEILSNPEVAKKYVIQNSQSQLLQFIKQLEKAKEHIMQKKLPNTDNYVIFYPDGYDG